MVVQTKKENWNHYWQLQEGSRFTRKSWSKIRMMKLLDKVLFPGAIVLDAGCGSGFFSQYFISKGCKVYTLDYSQEALEMARKVTQDQSAAYLEENLLDEKFADRYPQRFDFIFSDGLFEHFSEQDQKTIMTNFIRSKKQKGMILTFVPNRYSWWEVVRPFVMPGIHEVPFTNGRLSTLHEGLVIQKRGGVNVLPFSLSPENLGSKLGMLLYCFAR